MGRQGTVWLNLLMTGTGSWHPKPLISTFSGWRSQCPRTWGMEGTRVVSMATSGCSSPGDSGATCGQRYESRRMDATQARPGPKVTYGNNLIYQVFQRNSDLNSKTGSPMVRCRVLWHVAACTLSGVSGISPGIALARMAC